MAGISSDYDWYSQIWAKILLEEVEMIITGTIIACYVKWKTQKDEKVYIISAINRLCKLKNDVKLF